MELGGTPSDQYAGYVVEDSDLEYSECSEGERLAITLINAQHMVEKTQLFSLVRA